MMKNASPRRRRVVATAAGIAFAILLFAIGANGSVDPVTVGLVIAIGLVFGVAFYWSGGRTVD